MIKDMGNMKNEETVSLDIPVETTKVRIEYLVVRQ